MNIIEKLEGLNVFCRHCGKGGYVRMDDLRAILEEYKATAQAPVGFYERGKVFQMAYLYDDANLDDSGGLLFTHPPLSDETVKDAED